MGPRGRRAAFLFVLAIALGYTMLRVGRHPSEPRLPREKQGAVSIAPPAYRDPFVEELHTRLAFEGPAALLSEYRRRCAERPREAAPHAALGVLYGACGRDEEALPVLEKAAALGTTQGAVYGLLGSYCHEDGDDDDAAEQYRRETLLMPVNPWAFYRLGMTNLALDEIPDAIASLRRATELAPSFASAYAAMGNAFFRINDHVEAEKALRQCLVFDPANVLARDGLGRLHLVHAHLDAAEGVYRAALAKKLETPEIQQGLGVVLSRRPATRDMSQAALTCFLRAVELNPSYAQAHFDLAMIYQRQGRLEQAAWELRRATAIEPLEPQYSSALVSVLYKLGRSREAAALYRAGPDVELNRRGRAWLASTHMKPRDPEARYRLGSVYLRLRRFRLAAHQFRVLVRLEPHRARGYLQLIRAYEALGDHKRAARTRAWLKGANR